MAKSLAPEGTLLRRAAPDKPWEVVEPKDEVFSRDLMLALPLSQASVESKNGAVRLLFWGNVPQVSPFPILESAVVLHEPKGTDLDLSPQRGRVVLTNTKEKGAAKVRVRLPGADLGADAVRAGDGGGAGDVRPLAARRAASSRSRSERADVGDGAARAQGRRRADRRLP